MLKKIKTYIKKKFADLICKIIPELTDLMDSNHDLSFIQSWKKNTNIEEFVKTQRPFKIDDSWIGKGTYIAQNSIISNSKIGRFCSIGPNFLCGWGIHPTNGISTSPMFYSNAKQNGISFSEKNKIEERKPIRIGNDVFIGANVVILDGITIGDGAVIGAGAVVSKDIPPYSIAVGCPIQVIKERFPQEVVDKFEKIQWWNFTDHQLTDVEKYFFQVDLFVKKYDIN